MRMCSPDKKEPEALRVGVRCSRTGWEVKRLACGLSLRPVSALDVAEPHRAESQQRERESKYSRNSRSS